ncbi:hypothetical protein BG003_000990, partial [Podila horticola]
MADNHLTLFCLVDGEAASNAFPVDILPSKTIGDLKDVIKTKKTPRFDKVAADELTLWRVSIPDDDDEDEDEDEDKNLSILLDNISRKDKKKLKATRELSDVFIEKPARRRIHIVVQLLSPRPSDLGIIIRPEKKVAFTWSAFIDTATLDDLRKHLFDLYPQYAEDEYLEIYVYSGQPMPERICDNGDLRKILKMAKANPKPKLTISLETPTKAFAAWTFKDVISEYNLSESTDVGFEVIPPFTDVKAAPLDSELEKKVLDHLINEIGLRVDVLMLKGANEPTKSMVVASFLAAATKLFQGDLYLAAQRNLSGRRGNGPLDFSVHPRTTHSYTLGVTEVKKDDFRQGVAQNIVQLESALTTKKRKRSASDVDGEEPMEMRS